MATANVRPAGGPSPASASQLQFTSVAEANSYRLKAIVERLTFICKGGVRFDPAEFSSLCFSLARGVDYSLTISDVPAVAHRLPSLIKQTYQRRNDGALQPAIMVLSISAKNACKYGWFQTADADELLRMTNELFSSFCMTWSMPTVLANPLDVISKIIPRFYPRLKFCSLIVSFEAKTGYEVLMTDFQIPRNLPPEEKIRLFVVQTDNLETSSCIVSPPQVSFLVNGKGVERRTNVSLDSGPQFPTDITKMLKYGTNIIQSIGYFSGTYLIALAYICKLAAFNAPPLKDYVQPVILPANADSEIIEGASRITLNCPFSFRHIKTPVKGHSCKHHQCFDYDNFIEMNSRNPSWRCPFCNQSVSCIDLRIDRNMVKILEEVGKDVSNVVISADGSWNAVAEHNEGKDQADSGAKAGQQDCNMERESNRYTNTIEDAVDLTTEVEPLDVSIDQSDKYACETEDTKPFKHNTDLFGSQVLAESPPANYASRTTNAANSEIGNAIWTRNISTSVSSGSLACALGTSECLLPVVANPVNTDAIASVVNREPLVALESSQSSFLSEQLSQVGQLIDNMQLQLPQVGSSMVSRNFSRPISRTVNRSPVAVQALPVQSQAQLPNPFKRMRVSGPNNSSSTTPQIIQPLAEIPDVASGNMELHQYSRTPDISMTQDRDHQNQRYIRTAALQQAAGLLTPSPASMRVPSAQPRGDGAYRALKSAFDTQDAHRHLSNLRSHYVYGLPLGISRELSGQRATQQTVGPQGGAATTQSSRIAPSSIAMPSSPRLLSSEQPRDTMKLPSDQNWRPTGRMRGSLTGSAYSAALSQYLIPTQSTPRPPVSSVVTSTSGQLPELNADFVNGHGLATQPANPKPDGSGN